MRASSGSQVAASAVGLGSATDGSSGAQPMPRTPIGPSDMTSEPSPISGTAGSDHMSWPDSSRTLVVRSSRAIAAPMAVSIAVPTAASMAVSSSAME